MPNVVSRDNIVANRITLSNAFARRGLHWTFNNIILLITSHPTAFNDVRAWSFVQAIIISSRAPVFSLCIHLGFHALRVNAFDKTVVYLLPSDRTTCFTFPNLYSAFSHHSTALIGRICTYIALARNTSSNWLLFNLSCLPFQVVRQPTLTTFVSRCVYIIHLNHTNYMRNNSKFTAVEGICSCPLYS